MEITFEEQIKVKGMKELRIVSETSGTVPKAPTSELNIQRRREEKGYEKIFKEIIVENFPNMEKEIVNKLKRHKESHTG